ncbi:hypothetical protein V8C42DRAFT_349342 [Trichoderma barbatum]
MEQLRGAEPSDSHPMLHPTVHTAYDSSAPTPPALLPPRRLNDNKGVGRRGKALDQHLERIVGRIRLIIRVLSLLFTASIMIILAYTVAKYLKTQGISVTDDRSGFKMRVWPSDLKSRPTLVLLGVSATATFLNLVLCVASFSSIVRHLTNVGNIATVVVSTVAIILWLVAGILYKVDDLNKLKHYDMLSYVCTRTSDETLSRTIGNFSAMCIQMRYAWWAVIAVGLLELIALGTVVWAICAVKRKGIYAEIR